MDNKEQILRLIANDTNQRLQHQTLIHTLNLDIENPYLKDLVLPGTLTAILWSNNDERKRNLKELITSFTKEGEDKLNIIFKDAIKASEVVVDDEISIEEFSETLRKKKVLAKIKHGNRVIASSLYLDDEQEVTIIAVPYNGGELHDDGIVLEQLTHQSYDSNLNGLIITRTPQLSKIERIALSKVTEDQRYINVGILPEAMTTTWMAVAVVAVHVVAKMAGGRVIPDSLVLSDDRVRDLGSMGTAMELLKIRENILNGEIR